MDANGIDYPDLTMLSIGRWELQKKGSNRFQTITTNPCHHPSHVSPTKLAVYMPLTVHLIILFGAGLPSGHGPDSDLLLQGLPMATGPAACHAAGSDQCFGSQCVPNMGLPKLL